MLKISFAGLLLLISFDVMAQKITPNQVDQFVGEKVTICGKIAEISKNRNDTFINIDSPHPYQKFYFYANNLTLSKNYLFKNVCGTGVLSTHKGKFQIKITDIKSLSFN